MDIKITRCTDVVKNSLLILGAGQYGMVAREIAQSTGQFKNISFLDDSNQEAIGRLEAYEKLVDQFAFAIVAMGNPQMRLMWLDKLKQVGYALPVLVHPMAYVSTSAKLGEGTIVEPMAVVHSGARVMTGGIVCAGAVINHNATVECGCQIDCNAVVAANAVVFRHTKVQSGTVVHPNINK